jgi:hypothetical protein
VDHPELPFQRGQGLVDRGSRQGDHQAGEPLVVAPLVVLEALGDGLERRGHGRELLTDEPEPVREVGGRVHVDAGRGRRVRVSPMPPGGPSGSPSRAQRGPQLPKADVEPEPARHHELLELIPRRDPLTELVEEDDRLRYAGAVGDLLTRASGAAACVTDHLVGW